MSYPRYPQYKDSGIEWLGEIPAGWEIKKLNYVAKLNSGSGITSEMVNDSGQYPVYGGNGLRGYTGAYTHSGQYVLIGRQGALCGNVNYASGEFWASEHALVVSPTIKIEMLWLGELLRAMNLNQYSVSAAQPGLSAEQLSRLKIPFPPLPEQHAIAAFLDRETARVDDLIAKQEQMITLLGEKRKAIISHTVTRGLDPAVPMKDSGVEWLGMVPEHWEELRAKFLFQRMDRPTADDDEIVTAFRDGTVTLRKNRRTDGFTNSEKEIGYQGIRKGDLVIHETLS